MRYLIILSLCLPSAGCIFAPRLGAHVHRIRYQGQDYYQCVVVADERDLHLAEAALDVCKQGIEHPEPVPHK